MTETPKRKQTNMGLMIFIAVAVAVIVMAVIVAIVNVPPGEAHATPGSPMDTRYEAMRIVRVLQPSEAMPDFL